MAKLELADGEISADQIRPGDPYELSEGHLVYCAPSGSDSGRGVIAAALSLDTDPDVESSGAEVGFTPSQHTLRAPDLAIGGVPDQPGWVSGAPPIAIEYAGRGQHEQDLRKKIEEFLDAGSKYVWVVRLVKDRRVEVHEKGRPKVTKRPGQDLDAPGVLRNPVPVEALFDRSVAHDVALRNLLQRHGYDSLENVREEGREEGREEAQAQAILAVLEARGIEVSEEEKQRISATRSPGTLYRWIRDAVRVSSSAELIDRT